ncbi:hypothetical protein D9M71_221970 [compost metagenome]
MSTKDTPPPSTIASRGIQPRFGELVQGCRQLVMNRLAELLAEVFAQADDTLFDCAEKAENNKVQALFFDSMRDIRRQRPTMERAYHQRVAKGLVDFLEGRLSSSSVLDDADVEQLALVEAEEYEETVLVTNMVNRVKAQCAQALFALDQRLALLNNGRKISEDNNPFGPQAIARAFRETLGETSLPLRIKTVLYVLFEQKVMQKLAPLYEQLNNRLVEAGVLPNLKFRPQQSITRQPPQPSRGPSEAPATGPAEPSSATTAGQPGEHTPMASLDPGALYSSLASLLSEYRHSGAGNLNLGSSQSISSFTPDTATRTYSANELLDALNRLQKESAQDLAKRLRYPQPVGQLKADLHRQLEAGSDDPGQYRLTEQEADVIDLVGMVFDFILDDPNLPDSCKTALSHLHTPYLKVALQDKALFTQHHHPARRLLNTMAQAGVLYGGEGEERSLLAKMHSLVERVIQEFAGDLGLFDTLLADFNEYVAGLRQKVELRERRAVEAARGRDRLVAAREQAIALVRKAMHEHELPKLISNFLELSWSDALTFILLRNGEQSMEWRRACAVAEQLVWSVTPQDSDGREHLQAIRPGLLEDLRKGLEVLGGYHEDTIRRLLQDIVTCQHAIQAQQPQIAANLTPDLPESPLGAMLGDETEGVGDEPELSLRARTFIKELEQIGFGVWFEFSDTTPPRRLKLSWFSPTTHNYMFVDQSGQRAMVKPIMQLALEMERGLARLVPEDQNAPLMDRAMTAIYRMLQRFTARPPKTS